MKVFVPARLAAQATFSGEAAGVPLSGTWVDVPDYFRQLTNGNVVNDVIHAKLVDSREIPYLMGDQYVTLPKESNPRLVRQCSLKASSRLWYFTVAGYTTDLQTVALAPSAKYKGKHAKTKYSQRYVRVLHPIFCTYQCVGYTRDFLRKRFPRYTFTFTFECLRSDSDAEAEVGKSITVLRQQMKITSAFEKTPDGYNVVYSVGSGSAQAPFYTGALAYELISLLYSAPKYYTYEESEGYKHDTVWRWLEHRVENLVFSYLKSSSQEIIDQMRAYAKTTRTRPVVLCSPRDWPEMDFRSKFVLNEPEIIGERIDPVLVGNKGGISNYWINYLTQHAILEACNSLPRFNDNSMSNLIEIVSFIKSLVVDHKIEMPKSLGDAWLAYRYQYGTTKLDVEEAIQFVHRRMDLGTLDRQLVSYGQSSATIGDIIVTCRCSVAVTPKHISKLKEIWRALDTYGLTPDFYAIWDMIPYSFIVDWFLPISDLAGVLDANAMYFSGEFYTFDSLCYSLKYTREVDDYHISFYTRWAGSVPSSLNGFYWLEPPVAGGKTVVRRALDAASIFIG